MRSGVDVCGASVCRARARRRTNRRVSRVVVGCAPPRVGCPLNPLSLASPFPSLAHSSLSLPLHTPTPKKTITTETSLPAPTPAAHSPPRHTNAPEAGTSGARKREKAPAFSCLDPHHARAAEFGQPPRAPDHHADRLRAERCSRAPHRTRPAQSPCGAERAAPETRAKKVHSLPFSPEHPLLAKRTMVLRKEAWQVALLEAAYTGERS
jgi:hypothetical protein